MKRFRNEDYGFDDVDAKLIDTLGSNARISMRDLAELVGMSPPGVAERVRRLEDAGVIRAYTIDLDPKALGYALEAIVRVRPMPGQLHVVERLIREIPECVECDKVTGEDCFIARLCLQSIDALDGLVDKLSEKAETNSSIIKASTVSRRLPPLLKRADG